MEKLAIRLFFFLRQLDFNIHLSLWTLLSTEEHFPTDHMLKPANSNL